MSDTKPLGYVVVVHGPEGCALAGPFRNFYQHESGYGRLRNKRAADEYAERCRQLEREGFTYTVEPVGLTLSAARQQIADMIEAACNSTTARIPGVRPHVARGVADWLRTHDDGGETE